MNRISPWTIPPCLMAILALVYQARGNWLLTDSDTQHILEGIIARHRPWSWFWGDWPLANHFYRPLPSLTFELDHALYGLYGSGFGLTNAILGALCIVLTFWAIREITSSVATGSIAATLFGAFHTIPGWIAQAVGLAGIASYLIWLGLLRGGRQKFAAVALASLGTIFVLHAFSVSTDFSYRIMYWLPGRTASTMTVSCLLAMGAYARYERLIAGTIPPPMSPSDLPATKSTVVQKPTKAPWIWLVITVFGLIFALASYEQAVMLPGILFGIALLFRLQHRRPTWAIHPLFWLILVGYIALRWAILPHQISGYQAQQFRHGPGVLISLSNYLLPAVGALPSFAATVTMGTDALFTGGFWGYLIFAGANISFLLILAKDREKWPILALMVMAFVAYLPMAWQKYFGHYDYWPASIWCGALVVMSRAVGRQIIIAVSPPALQAPARRDPAPGWLPHP